MIRMMAMVENTMAGFDECIKRFMSACRMHGSLKLKKPTEARRNRIYDRNDGAEPRASR